MLPDHCKDVSLRTVDFELTEENIRRHAKGKKAYTRTDFMVLKNGERAAIVCVAKRDGKELFRDITSIEVLALPEDVVMVNDERVNVLNPSEMARAAGDHPGKWTVVKGMFNHVSFAHADGNLELRVFDVVPPYPSKLSLLVEMALATGLVDLPVVPVAEVADLSDMDGKVETEQVMFPCRASGLASARQVLFLDETPEIECELTLIGCDLSRRIFHSVYRTRPAATLEMCPQEIAPQDASKRIIKCCRIKEGFVIQGNRAVVPWGATVQEVAEAINALFEDAPHGRA